MKLATRKTETQEMRAPHLQTGHHVICISQKDITTEIYHTAFWKVSDKHPTTKVLLPYWESEGAKREGFAWSSLVVRVARDLILYRCQ